MAHNAIRADNTVFVILSFEGPDRYSLAGGLGVRVTHLADTLAKKGFPTHLFFVGDPKGKGEETIIEGKLWLHRWCQWISEYYPNGVYQGENEKLYDFNRSIPWFITENIIKPAIAQDKIVVILGEEWHTTEVMSRLSDKLYYGGIRDKVVMFWNANNTFGFDRIDWQRLSLTATVTTVSRYMKYIMRELGLNPLVIPNGIPRSLLNAVDEQKVAEIRKNVQADILLSKVARWDPDKCWNQAVEATAMLKSRGMKPVLLARGGIEPHGYEVIKNACSLGLSVKDVKGNCNSIEAYCQAVTDADNADILNIRFFCPQDFLRLVYHASDAVLANSGHEPFGLVGLETMAAGGIPFTGGTGEDYAVHFNNAIVLETIDPREIEAYVLYLNQHPVVSNKMRQTAKRTAANFTWENVIENLIRKLEYQAGSQGLLTIREVEPPESTGCYQEHKKCELVIGSG